MGKGLDPDTLKAFHHKNAFMHIVSTNGIQDVIGFLFTSIFSSKLFPSIVTKCMVGGYELSNAIGLFISNLHH
ncbi:hypothetical protein TetV_229 [Tetraselmis virus 1]|uniref:Uncharacterized protein n=1 Tax=Tetraselmis virus 1 TaxID=2060617 RepID=A0A2P0VN47_9VIRU|nr:hypothetical protein QJ968_gp229 [Tetraselmis virus 1]AUF82321.1 hypothetical protein TetV_229 [Tetraselmis virus 1]